MIDLRRDDKSRISTDKNTEAAEAGNRVSVEPAAVMRGIDNVELISNSNTEGCRDKRTSQPDQKSINDLNKIVIDK